MTLGTLKEQIELLKEHYNYDKTDHQKMPNDIVILVSTFEQYGALTTKMKEKLDIIMNGKKK